jgi:hypothetical protein
VPTMATAPRKRGASLDVVPRESVIAFRSLSAGLLVRKLAPQAIHSHPSSNSMPPSLTSGVRRCQSQLPPAPRL